MLLERMGETVTLETADGTEYEVEHVLCKEADQSDQSVMDVQTRFINQARYKGDARTLQCMWPKDAPTHDLMDGHLTIRGERYRIYAAPFPVAHPWARYDMRVTCMRALYLYEVELVIPGAMALDPWGTPMDSEETVIVTPANLLRLSEMEAREARQDDLSSVTLFELPPGTWDDRVSHYRFGGETYAIGGVDKAGETVVISGTRLVTDRKAATTTTTSDAGEAGDG